MQVVAAMDGIEDPAGLFVGLRVRLLSRRRHAMFAGLNVQIIDLNELKPGIRIGTAVSIAFRGLVR